MDGGSRVRPATSRSGGAALAMVFVVAVLAAAGVAWLLVTIFEHQQEAKDPYLKLVRVTEDTTDPEPWGVNFPRQYDGYKQTATTTRTRFGGHGGSEAMPEEKIEREPWLKRMFAGYAFSIDYRDRRGHAYMLYDQEHTARVTQRPQPGSCLHCHASVMPAYRELGGGDVFKGLAVMCGMTYADASALVTKVGSANPVPNGNTQTMTHVGGAHPVSCVDCHDPNDMRLRVTRPGFITGIQAYKASLGVADFDPNRDATRQEMRTFVCAQCHVEYYCGPKTTLFLPWGQGLRVEQIEKFYDEKTFPDGSHFYDWAHAETGAHLYKAQHPEFELYSQGVHAAAGVACADCHMPFERQGAMKVSDHWIRSPLLNLQRACQTCHNVDQEELARRVDVIQERNSDLLHRAGAAVVDMLDALAPIRAAWERDNAAAASAKAGSDLASDASYAAANAEERATKLAAATKTAMAGLWSKHLEADAELQRFANLHRRAQWRIDFVAAENSMGFHAPQEAARILGEAIDFARQAETVAVRLGVGGGGDSSKHE
ncbi:MAG: ammonia-forming cytochrome c nitrite reductase subunit c552 [Planctomycetes bacterium]|nr:ammonia-forming cytochrome c nitrite reductase subunit c552 [Planctomycetota bacterium]